MAEVITGEFSKFRSNLIEAHADTMVWLWDCGPEEPELPEAPEPPEGKDGEPKYDLAKLQYKRKLKAYEAALEQYERDDKDYQSWHHNNNGAVEVMFWSTNARDALANDALAVKEKRQTQLRWYVSSRTRGYGNGSLAKDPHAKTGKGGIQANGLPIGTKPGKRNQENIDRQLAGEKEFVALLKADPHFGQEAKAS